MQIIHLIKYMFGAVLFSLTVLLLWNMSDYFRVGAAHPFVQEKTAVMGSSHLWFSVLIVHVAAAITCIACTLFQLSTFVRQRFPQCHRMLGKLYASGVLLVLVPTGFYLGLFAKGGVLGALGFWLTGYLAFVFTIRGIASVMAGDIVAHQMWMYRSYAMLATALSFRCYHILFHVMGMAPDTNYLASLWLSLIGNIVIAELIIYRKTHEKVHTHRSAHSLPIQHGAS